MPIYDYTCQSCQTESEHFHSINAQIPNCPHCGATSLQKAIKAPRVRLTGSGYYETDEKPADKQRNLLRKDSEAKEKKD